MREREREEEKQEEEEEENGGKYLCGWMLKWKLM